MATDNDITDALKTLAQGPQKATGDAGSVEMPDLTQVIEVDRYLSSKNAAGNARRGIRFQKIVPPGAD